MAEKGTFEIEPKVNEVEEFIEIAYDFANPLDLVREAISNSFDAKADLITIGFEAIQKSGRDVLKITIADNGVGMDKEGLQSFFDLGNSLRKGDETCIGEKGHGTKIYFNSEKIEVITCNDGTKYHAFMDDPRDNLFRHKIPSVNVEIEDCEDDSSGTQIYIWGYNDNTNVADKLTHAQLKDYILWFTKFGSIEKEFGVDNNKNVKLKIKGIDRSEYEELEFGHVFPEENGDVDKLYEEYSKVDAPKHYCKKFIYSGPLEDKPYIKYSAIFVVEGKSVKIDYNKMIRHQGYNAPAGAYQVQERYGLWLCKDFIPIERKNEWITKKGSDFTKFHAFINCQSFKLTANRGSVANTPSDIMTGIEKTVRNLYEKIIQGDDWMELDWLEGEAETFNTIETEKKEFEWRRDKVNKASIAEFQGIHLIEPQRESGVFSIFMQLSSFDENIFPFTVVDYDTHSGIDVIVKGKDKNSIKESRLFYVEFKCYLTKDFNHSFENVYSIICWDISLSDINHNQEVVDIAQEHRTLHIIPPENDKDYTRYYLDDKRSERKIEVFVLKYYLKEKFKIEFKPRTEDSIV